MAGYVFIGNSTKPSEQERNSRDVVIPGNVSIPCIEAAIKLGYDVYLGINRNKPQELDCTYPIKLYDSHTYRSITAFSDNKIAYTNLSKVVKYGDIEVIHCNTPIGGLIGRLIGKRHHVKKVIYTAHGFHFYKGAPLFNNTILKLAELIMARWTDAIITMNEEDYQAAKKFKLKKNGKVFKVHGVGITLEDFKNINVDFEKKRKELNLKNNDVVCISAGDLVQRKNYGTAITALAKTNNKNIHYLICGIGPEKEKLENLASENGVLDNVHFLGFRTDVKELMKISDIFLFTTLQEGLPRSMMEAMACGLPCIASRIRGNTDLIDEGSGGYLCDPNAENIISEKIEELAKNEKLRKKMGSYNLGKINEYDIKVVKNEIQSIYNQILI